MSINYLYLSTICPKSTNKSLTISIAYLLQRNLNSLFNSMNTTAMPFPKSFGRDFNVSVSLSYNSWWHQHGGCCDPCVTELSCFKGTGRVQSSCHFNERGVSKRIVEVNEVINRRQVVGWQVAGGSRLWCLMMRKGKILLTKIIIEESHYFYFSKLELKTWVDQNCVAKKIPTFVLPESSFCFRMQELFWPHFV